MVGSGRERRRTWPWGTLAALLLIAACRSAQTEVPPELLGRWTSDDARFAGRAMLFESTAVTFEPGDGTSASHLVTAVESIERERATGLVVHYANELGREHRLALTLSAGAATLQLDHRPEVVWVRRAETP